MSLIRNTNQVKQSIDFTGIENGKIHPSDIDAVLEFDNKYLILFEVKRINNELPTGQRLLLERMCDNWGGKSIVLFVWHNFKDDTKDIPLIECSVEKYYFNKKWTKAKKETTIITALRGLHDSWGIEKLKGL